MTNQAKPIDAMPAEITIGLLPALRRARVEQLFRCAHPFFGPIAVNGPPTPETALSIGQAIGGAALLSDYDRENIGNIIAEHGTRGEFSNFSAHLLRLIKKADADNRRALALVYPEHVQALEEWERTALSKKVAGMAPAGGGVTRS